jgi:hypothetical protein
MAMSEVKKNFLDEGGDGADEPSCPMCHGPGKLLGSLGAKEHFMCRNCGVGFHREAAPEAQPQPAPAAPVQKGALDMGMASGAPGANMTPGGNSYGGMGGGSMGMGMSEKEPSHQPVAAPDAMSMKEETPGESHGREESSSASASKSAMGKAEMCKACGYAHDESVPHKDMAKATDFVDVNGKHATKGLAPRAKLPPASPENQGPGLSGPASKEVPQPGSGGDPKAAKKAEPPMAKPPSGQNMGTAVPSAKPKAPKVAGAPGAPAIKAEELSKPPVSQAQRAAMGAAASGHSTLGIPKKVGKEFIDADKGGKLPEKKAEESMGKAALPAAPKAQMAQHMNIAGSKAAAAPAAAGAKPAAMPSPAAHAGRAQAFGAAAAGAFQPKGPISSGLELAPKKPAGMQAPTSAARTPGGTGQAPKPMGMAPKAPGLMRSAGEKTDLKKADLGNCVLCNRPEHAGTCEQ